MPTIFRQAQFRPEEIFKFQCEKCENRGQSNKYSGSYPKGLVQTSNKTTTTPVIYKHLAKQKALKKEILSESLLFLEACATITSVRLFYLPIGKSMPYNFSN